MTQAKSNVQKLRYQQTYGSVNYDIGTGGDYDTINEALLDLGRGYSPYVTSSMPEVTLTLLSGFEMAEEVHVLNGMNYGWITILSEDATVSIDRSALVTPIGNTYNNATFSTQSSAQLPQNTYAPFMAYNGSTLPRIGCLFDMDGSGSTTINVYGVLIHGNSNAHVLYGCGVKNVAALNASYEGRGLSVNHGSTFTGWGSVWSGADISARISNASVANLRSSDLSGSRIGLDLNGVCIAAAQDSDISGCTQNALYILGAGNVKVSNADMSNCGSGGSVSGTYATIRAIGICQVDASGAILTGGKRGIQAESGARVEWNSGVSTSMAGATIYAMEGGHVFFNYAEISGSASEGGVFAASGSRVVGVGASVINNGTYNGIYAAGGFVSIPNGTITGNGGSGGRKDLFISNGGTIEAYNTKTTNSVEGVAPYNPVIGDTNATRFGQRTKSGIIYGSADTVLYGSTTFNPADLTDGTGETATVTVTGAGLGDFVEAVSFSLDLQGISLTAYVSATNTVSVRFQNETGGNLNLASGTLRVIVRKA